MRILFHSNAPWSTTGYGNQTGIFIPRLAEHHEIAVSAFYGLEGARIRWNGIPIFPGMGGDFGTGYLLEHCRHWFPDQNLRGGLLMTLMDVWVLNPNEIAQTHAACWTPVDHEPVSPGIKKFFQESSAIPIAMSRFGQKELEDFDPLYVPHGIDVDQLKPQDRDECREQTGIPKDAFLVGMVAANKGHSPSRKGFQQAIEAFAEFRRRHDDAMLYMHTIADPKHSQGEDIRMMVAGYGIPLDSVLLADQYDQTFNPPSVKAMARIYSTMDVLLNPALGEGFGIPIVEAQACGLPVIATDFSAMKETAAVGWRVQGRSFWTGQRSWLCVPDVGEIVDALEDCYGLSDEDRRKTAKRARGHALNYAADKVLRDHWLPALEEVEARIADTPQLEAVA
jgi:glycosyltransferase involved in cell wall biosynthesis